MSSYHETIVAVTYKLFVLCRVEILVTCELCNLASIFKSTLSGSFAFMIISSSSSNAFDAESCGSSNGSSDSSRAFKMIRSNSDSSSIDDDDVDEASKSASWAFKMKSSKKSSSYFQAREQ